MLQKPKWKDYDKDGVVDWRAFSKALLLYTKSLEDRIVELQNQPEKKQNIFDDIYSGFGG